MHLNSFKSRASQSFSFASRKNISLSTYFPAGTQYFYGYPAGEDSGFLNQVPPSVEELVASRAVSCAGDHVSVIEFAATTTPKIEQSLLDAFEIPQISRSKRIVLPQEIDCSLTGNARNDKIKDSLLNTADCNSLIMAQPYTSKDMRQIYQISPRLTTWLNDKQNMSQLISDSLMPAKYGSFANGTDFVDNYGSIQLPCVVKASSSSSGDGVYICKTKSDLDNAARNLADISGTIIAEQYIVALKNYGVHFGIPHDKSQPVDFIGINEQLTTDEGEFIGGIIKSNHFPAELKSLRKILMNDILPKVRELGWYGVGCFDVLTDEAGRTYFIDCNFRMTGMSAYHFLVANHTINTPLIGFSGDFVGSQQDLVSKLLPLAQGKRKIVQLITLSKNKNVWSFNGALFFNKDSQLQNRVDQLLETGIKSAALSQLSSRY